MHESKTWNLGLMETGIVQRFIFLKQELLSGKELRVYHCVAHKILIIYTK